MRLSVIPQPPGSSGLDTQAVLDMDVARFDVDYNLIDKNGTIRSNVLSAATYSALPTASTVSGKVYVVTGPTPAFYYSNGISWYQVGGNEPVYTWATIPDPTTMPLGACVRVDPSSFGGTHKNPLGILVETDGTNWRPKGGRQKMASAANTLASPLYSLTFTGSDALFAPAAQFSMPAGLLAYEGIGVHVKALFGKTGADAVASTFRVKMGKNNNAVTSDIIFSATTTAVAGRQFKVDAEARVTATGASGTFLADGMQGNGQGTALIFDRTTYLDTTVPVYVLFTGDGTATTGTGGLYSFSIDLIG